MIVSHSTEVKMDQRSPYAAAADAAQAKASQAAKYPYRLEGDAAQGYTIVSNETDEAVSEAMDHHAAARECGRRNLAATR